MRTLFTAKAEEFDLRQPKKQYALLIGTVQGRDGAHFPSSIWFKMACNGLATKFSLDLYFVHLTLQLFSKNDGGQTVGPGHN
jgi:hypothetical protein